MSLIAAWCPPLPNYYWCAELSVVFPWIREVDGSTSGEADGYWSLLRPLLM